MIKNFQLTAVPDSDGLKIVIDGKIDSNNAKEFSDTVASMRKQHPNGEAVFDCRGLEYISSAGLRVFLMLKQKEKEPIRLINVSQPVNDILDVTGFSKLFEVSRAMRDVSGESVQKFGYSGAVTVYRMGSDMLLKVYAPNTPLSAVEQERNYAQAAFLSGVPTLIAYDIVTYNGCYGMLYELPKTAMVSDLIENTPWKLEQYAAGMGKLLKVIHSSEPEAGVLPNTSELFENWARKMSPWLAPQEIDILLRMIHVIPEGKTIVYGNYNTRNVFMHQGELIVINMAGISCGNPIYDLGTAYMNYISVPEMLAKRMTGLEALQTKKFWHVMMRAYFDTDDDKIINEHEKTIHAAAQLRSVLSPAIGPASAITKDETERFIAHARRELFPAAKAEQAINLLAAARF